MEILRSVIGGSETVSQVSSAETIERLVDRVNTSTLIDDRRDACRALRAMSKKFRQVISNCNCELLIPSCPLD